MSLLHQQPNETTAVIRSTKVLSHRRRDGLIRYAFNRTSQNGEDGIIERIFQLIERQHDCDCHERPRRTRLCVDVGAWDGMHLSNTHSLLCSDTERWRGILVEADPQRFEQLSELYANTNNVLINVNISVINPNNNPNSLHHILKNHITANLFDLDAALDTQVDVDFLCIDIDGSDYFVLYDLLHLSQIRPTVICIEFNPTMPNDLIYIPPRSDSQRHGTSLAALIELASEFDYVLVETTLYNAFFVRRKEYNQFLIREVYDTSIEALHENTMGTTMYQLYDGSLKLWGCKRMLWHRIPMDENKLQMLSEDKRSFPFAPTSTSIVEPFRMSDVVNMSSYCNSTETEASRQICASELYTRLQKDGFAFIRGTGIDHKACHKVLEACHNFLQLADEDVRRSCLAVDRARRGYSPMNRENFASLLGEKAPNDLVRKFRIGRTCHVSENGAGDSSLLQPNIWPSTEVWNLAAPFQSALEEYYETACSCAQTVVEAICDGVLLAHPDLYDSLQPLMEAVSADELTYNNRTSSILTMLGYRAGTRHKGKSKGPLVAAHTDVGVVTMLLFDGFNTCASLQRCDGQGGWIDVELPATVPSDPVFVINVADLLSDLSQQRLPSTIHRIIARPESTIPRNCCALFVGLEPKTRLTIGSESMSYEEWRKHRIAKAARTIKES